MFSRVRLVRALGVVRAIRLARVTPNCLRCFEFLFLVVKVREVDAGDHGPQFL